MEVFSPEWLGALVSIIIIDLVLAGDNAVVIAIAANSLPKEQQKKAVLFGTAGAIIVRAIFAIFAIYLLRIPFISAIGGLLLFFIAYKLINKDSSAPEHTDRKASSFFDAMMLIIVADAVMGIDNALAIAGAAKDDISLVIFGLLLSIPIIMWGSFLILRLIKKYPIIIWFGAGLLGYIGGDLIVRDAAYSRLENRSDIFEYIAFVIQTLPVIILFVWGLLIHKKRTTSSS